MTELAGQDAYELRPDVVATILDHGALLLDLDSKYFYLLNPTGWAIVQLFEDQGATIDHALERSRTWGAPPADLAAVRGLIDEMVGQNLLVSGQLGPPVAGEPPAEWLSPTIERQAEPLQKVIVSAFDPSIPLAE